jgi:hypothetical protein
MELTEFGSTASKKRKAPEIDLERALATCRRGAGLVLAGADFTDIVR